MDNPAEPRLPDRATPLGGEAPAQRLISLLELISTRDQVFTLQSLAVQTGLPKPTLHRMLQQLESGGWLTRHNDGRHFATGVRLRRMAEDTLLNDTRQGARRLILSRLVDDIGESCHLAAVSGSGILILDAVETDHPLRVHLAAGHGLPVHASAAGKIVAAQYGRAQRERLLVAAELRRYTPGTMTDPDEISAAFADCREQGYAVDDEEYILGLVSIAVLVPNGSGRSNLSIGVQAPMIRTSRDDLIAVLPRLRAAAEQMAQLDRIDQALGAADAPLRDRCPSS